MPQIILETTSVEVSLFIKKLALSVLFIIPEHAFVLKTADKAFELSLPMFEAILEPANIGFGSLSKLAVALLNSVHELTLVKIPVLVLHLPITTETAQRNRHIYFVLWLFLFLLFLFLPFYSVQVEFGEVWEGIGEVHLFIL